METYLASEQDLINLAGQLALAISEGAYIYLIGPLGAGKTTFVRGFLYKLGVTGKVKSPTYTLVEPYYLPHQTIFHFDLYRLQDASELHEIGIMEYFLADNICFIEWPEKGSPLLPPADITCYIDFEKNGRQIRFIAHTKRGEKILNEVQKE